MTMDEIVLRLANPGILAILAVAGIAYSRILWVLNLQPVARLWAVAFLPGGIFLAVLWAIRAAQGSASAVWPLLLADWLIFATAAFVTVMLARRRAGR